MDEQELTVRGERRRIGLFEVQAFRKTLRVLIQRLRVHKLDGCAPVSVERVSEAVTIGGKAAGRCFPLCVGDPGFLAGVDVEQGDVAGPTLFIGGNEEGLAIGRNAGGFDEHFALMRSELDGLAGLHIHPIDARVFVQVATVGEEKAPVGAPRD